MSKIPHEATYWGRWEANQRREQELKQRQQQLVKEALAQLKRAQAEDKASGVTAASELRDKPVTRPAVLSERLSALDTPERHAKLKQLQEAAQIDYDNALVMAAPGRLTQEQILKELPGAILRTQQRLAAEEAAARGQQT